MNELIVVLERLLASREHLDADGVPLTVVDAVFALAESVDRLTRAVAAQEIDTSAPLPPLRVADQPGTTGRTTGPPRPGDYPHERN